jgi:DNA-binding PadR family transcriptional regulator
MMILGLVQWLEPVHGYDVRRELLSWSADKWANVQPGSIYHGLRKLADEGLLHEVATEQVGGRPARTTYGITDKGKAEFQSLLRNGWWNLTQAADPFMAAFSFLPGTGRTTNRPTSRGCGSAASSWPRRRSPGVSGRRSVSRRWATPGNRLVKFD